ncbi:MAG TPA: polysaccharide biosynthesis/export family protein [Terriglobales bacterium]|jgi:polysaccharide biosynthesis/export protein|nr:polysaccharide biosynthesis/export family protein [Terriglobales bacterium]
MSKQSRLSVILLLVALVTPAWAQTTAYEPIPWNAATSNGGAAQKPAAQDPNYVIGAQDVLDISVWKEAELTRTVPVRPDGKISLPLLNDVQAAGLTPTQLAEHLTNDLKKFVTDPQVTVIVSQINSQRIYILGEVNRAGAYPLLPQMTILQGLSSAGGFTQFANLKKIYMFRMENGKQVKYPFNYKDVIDGKRSDENVTLKAGDTIVVP